MNSNLIIAFVGLVLLHYFYSTFYLDLERTRLRYRLVALRDDVRWQLHLQADEESIGDLMYQGLKRKGG